MDVECYAVRRGAILEEAEAGGTVEPAHRVLTAGYGSRYGSETAPSRTDAVSVMSGVAGGAM